MAKRIPAVDRVLDRCIESDELFNGLPCWIFTGALTNGYGQVRDGGKTHYTHRVVFEALAGPIPDGLSLDHLCRVRACVNPAHLEAVTHRVNVLRGESPAARCAQATHCPQGHAYDVENTRIEKNSRRFCRTCDRVKGAAIKAAHEHLGLSQRAYIATYGQSVATALKVVNG